MATKRVRAELPGGAIVWVEATPVNNEAEVSGDLSTTLKLDQLGTVMSGLAAVVHTAVSETKPTKTTAEFALEVGLEAGQLTALLVKGTASASITVTLEW